MGDLKRNPVIHGENPHSEEISFSQLVLIFWSYRRWIFACTALVTMLGVLHAFLSQPIYYSQAIIALKESGKGDDASRIFSRLGGMGSMMAGQFGMGNTSLDKLEIVLKGHELAEAVITRHNLMPALFPKSWDKDKKAWVGKVGAGGPPIKLGVKALRGRVLSVSTDKKKSIIIIGAFMPDSVQAKQVVDNYLLELNLKIRTDVITDADGNRRYLESQLNLTTDPMLMEKLHSMISFEIEKKMLVSERAFEVLEGPVIPMERIRPKRKTITAISFVVGLFVSIAGLFLWISLGGIREGLRRHPSAGREVKNHGG